MKIVDNNNAKVVKGEATLYTTKVERDGESVIIINSIDFIPTELGVDVMQQTEDGKMKLVFNYVQKSQEDLQTQADKVETKDEGVA